MSHQQRTSGIHFLSLFNYNFFVFLVQGFIKEKNIHVSCSLGGKMSKNLFLKRIEAKVVLIAIILILPVNLFGFMIRICI